MLCFLFYFSIINSQTISVDDSGYTPEELVNLLSSDNCTPITNVATSSNQSVAYFNNNNGNFPLTEGVLIRNGIARHSQGSFTNTNLGSQINTNGDTDLQAISDSEGQMASITDVAFLEFDFLNLSSQLNFNYVFASNEYGQWQCGFSDVFAILLTNLDTGVTTNMAILPNTNTNISVRNIRDNQYNSSCTSVNSNLFSVYNVNNSANSSLNMRGHTVSLNANAAVIPNTNYKIRFVIGDYNDSDFDSAVFIESDSFTSSIDLGNDIVSCDGNDVTIDTNLNNNPNFSYQWLFNNVPIAGEIESSITVSDTGDYTVIVNNINTNCELRDSISIIYLSTEEPNDVYNCMPSSNEYNLTENNVSTLNLDPLVYEVFYYNSIVNANTNNSIPNNQLTAYNSVGNETIYIRIRNINTQQFCTSLLDFELIPFQFTINSPQDINTCLSDGNVNIPNSVENDILNGLNSSDYTVSYFLDEQNSIDNVNAIDNPSSFNLPSVLNPPNTPETINIYVRVQYNNSSNCFQLTNFDIIVNPSPPVDSLDDMYVCTEFILPNLTNGNYFTGPNGTGTALSTGDSVTTTSTVYIYNIDANGCSNQSSFLVEIIEEYTIEERHCGQFTVPGHPTSNFYTQTGGPMGSGTIITPGTIITTNQTIYFYGLDSDDNFCEELEFDIEILDEPNVDEPQDVFTCNSYILPPLTEGNYFTGDNGSGTQLNAGDTITTTSTIYIFNSNTDGCVNNSSFVVNIINTNSFQNVDACATYTLPTIAFGDYYTGANGSGNVIPQGTQITTSQTVHYYASEITTATNCTEDISFIITINPLPPVDSLNDIDACIDDLPKLPILTNGNYFTGSNGTGTQLFQGDEIDTSQTIYIYNSDANCDAETSFSVNIRELPLVYNFTDIFSCDPYVLPALVNGNYFTLPNGQGQQLNSGDLIETTQSIYIYNEYSDFVSCNNQNVFEVQILGVEVDELDDVIACENYVLPLLNSGNYYTEEFGQGQRLFYGDVITQSQTLYIYAENGNRFSCFDQTDFTITIVNKPILNTPPNLEACGSVTLVDTSTSTINIEYFRDIDLTNKIEQSDYNITEIGTQVIFIKASVVGASECFSQDRFQVTVYPLRELVITGGIICVDDATGQTTNPFLLNSYLSPNEFQVNWYLNNVLVGTGPTYNATEAGIYSVETIKLTPDIVPNCNYKTTQVEILESRPVFEIEYLTNDFLHTHPTTITHSINIATVNEGLGNYIYSLDGINFQTSSLFTGITPGEYIIVIRDTSNICGEFRLNYVALNYPKFFTPNGDNTNEYWNIKDLQNNPEATIEIFNRNGKPMAIIKPSETGWDGNYKGNPMPSSDYWFIVRYQLRGIRKEFKSHFSLLRK